jgi:phosphoglycerate dehydrogenase-like enzyme
MIKKKYNISVTSRSFSRSKILRSELNDIYENVKFNESGEKFTVNSLCNFLIDCDKAIIGLEEINEQLLAQLPRLKVVSKYGVGLDSIDLHALKKFKVALGWTPGVNKRSVSELALGMIIGLLRKIPAASSETKLGEWRQDVGQNLSGKTVGIIGFGNIGKDLAVLLEAFGCKILAFDIVEDKKFSQKHCIKYVGLNELLTKSEVISLHLPFNENTKNILSLDKLDLINQKSILINTARGGLVDENALYKKLKDGRMAGAAFDVFSCEPPRTNSLLKLNNFIATPHIGGSSEEAILAMGRAAINGLENNLVPS